MLAHPFYPFPPHGTVTTAVTTTTFSFIGRRFHGIGLFITMSVETSDLLRLMNTSCITWEGKKQRPLNGHAHFLGESSKKRQTKSRVIYLETSPQEVARKGNGTPAISAKSRLVKFYSLTRFTVILRDFPETRCIVWLGII